MRNKQVVNETAQPHTALLTFGVKVRCLSFLHLLFHSHSELDSTTSGCASKNSIRCGEVAWASLTFGGADEDARAMLWGCA